MQYFIIFYWESRDTRAAMDQFECSITGRNPASFSGLFFPSFQMGDNESCECNISYCFINWPFSFFYFAIFDGSW